MEATKRSKMSKGTRRALKRMAKNIRTRTPSINQRLARSGSKANRALVFTAAKYYAALNKLAEK
jgi:hypothetical protein